MISHSLRGSENGRREARKNTSGVVPAKAGIQRKEHEKVPWISACAGMTELPVDPFGRLNHLLGYVIAIVALAMLVHAIRPPP